MALIVLQHTSVDNFPVDPNYSQTTNGMILQGNLVGLDASGNVQLAGSSPATNNNSTVLPLGIAGDSIASSYQTTPYSAQLIIGRGKPSTSGVYPMTNPNVTYSAPTRWTSNRVSDMYNETLASGAITVYIGSGRFATDQYDTAVSWTLGAPLYTNTTGKWTNASGVGAYTSRTTGYLLKAPTAYPSGVPGADVTNYPNSLGTEGAESPSVNGSMSLGNYLEVSLSI